MINFHFDDNTSPLTGGYVAVFVNGYGMWPCLFILPSVILLTDFYTMNHFLTFSRYKALESMMEEALKKSMEIKEEKIHALESR